MIGKMEHRTLRCIMRSSGAACVALGLMALAPLPSQAATYSVLYSFTGKPKDGAYGYGTLVQDDAGNLYSTTIGGGRYDWGTVFKLDTAGNETVLTNFDYGNGQSPEPGLIMHKGNLYGTTDFGGVNNAGVLFKVNSNRSGAKSLYNFCSLANCADGFYPGYGVTRDSAGNLYGTTNGGGAYNSGVVFKVDSGGNETVLYSFCPGGGDCKDGTNPFGSGVARDSAGNLYGFAQGGDIGGKGACGVVWKLNASGNESVLHTFSCSPDGSRPEGLLTIDGTGNLYGVTNVGGNSGTACGGYGCGTVFKVDSNGNETVLYNFTGGTDGADPNFQALVLDKRGNLYGTAEVGGTNNKGTVFKLSPSGKFKVLYSFQGQSDGGVPGTGLLLKHGVLYGETNIGGDLNCSESPGSGCGVVFKITNP